MKQGGAAYKVGRLQGSATGGEEGETQGLHQGCDLETTKDDRTGHQGLGELKNRATRSETGGLREPPKWGARQARATAHQTKDWKEHVAEAGPIGVHWEGAA
ncbi:hypothetical protein GOP47_0005658 [Adiantum capillus-veneris]|uniref:Uncharacterized protein n=1 Tax=Adiantum capillus-veneris TaxID=13818 RepID=A0A9D4V5Z8_ADICA|nr:hypothetical protein GOP47_0005658 [Adiantum capillus-veneris]